jgi:glycosyltransferase involved in cell wall biosynthesis
MINESKEQLVVILMATFNGSAYLDEQLKSISNQSYQNWQLIISDDGSDDETLQILRDFQRRYSSEKVVIRSGPNKGSASNFLSMLSDSVIRGEYYAFSDQDDVWLPNKLEAAVAKLNSFKQLNLPYLYCGRSIYVDENLKKITESPLFTFPQTFRNALVQNIAGGNTMVFNHSIKKIFELIKFPDVPVHDWLVYMVATGIGGVVFYDSNPYLLYRQHPRSLIGGGFRLSDKLKNMRRLFDGDYQKCVDLNVDAIDLIKPYLTHENENTFGLFKLMRTANLKDRFRLMIAAGIYRQTARGTFSLLLALLFRKI